MSIRARVLGPLLLLLAATAIVPLAVEAAAAPVPASAPVVPSAQCSGPLSANTEITDVSAVTPSRVDVLGNDCKGVASISRPLTITSVGQGAYGTVTTDGTTVTYDPRGCTTGPASGQDFFNYTITDGTTSKSGLAVVRIVRPATSPVTDAPQAGFIPNSTIGSTVPLKVSWCGVLAAGTTLKGYRFEQSTNAGVSFPTVLSAATTATSMTRSVSLGKSYAWRVATTDKLNRVGGFAASLTSRVALIQDSSASVSYSRGWSSAAGSKYSGGRERYTSKAGATATITVSNVRAVAIVTSRATARGGFYIYVDGVKVTPKAISEKSGTAAWRRVLYVRGLTSGAGVTHRIQFRAAGNGRVDLDAFMTLSGKRDQAVTFSTTAPTDAAYQGTDYAVAATSTSGLPVNLSLQPSSWTACSLTAGVVTFHGSGTCRINATQSGDVTWNAGTAFQTFTVAKRTITVTGITASDRAYDGTAAATLDVSGAAFGPTDVLAGDIVTLNTAGATGTFTPDGSAGAGKTVQIAGLTLAGADSANYAVTQPTTTASISTIDLTVSFIAADRFYDGTTAAAISSCSVATVLAGDVVTCDHSGATASFANANAGSGKTVTGTGFALAGADAASYVIDTVDTTTADIAKALQTVTFTSSAPVGADVGTNYTPTATATSGLPATITVDPGAAAVCHIAAGVVTADADGTCILSADQAGDANHEAAPQDQQSFPVGTGLLAQTISFDLSGKSATYGGAPVGISGTATSGLTVGFASLTSSVCTVAGSSVTVVTSGTCTIRASQAGNGSYAAAPNVDDSFTIAQRVITVTAVTDTKIADGTTSSDGVPTITSGTLAAGDTATWTESFNSAAIGTGKTLTPTGTVAHGVADRTASYDITFVANSTGVIDGVSQSISFDLSGVNATYGGAPVGISATATSGLTVGFASLTSSVCTVSGSNVTILAAGTCTIRASQPGSAIYDPAPAADESFTVDQRAITVTAVTDTKVADGTTDSDGIPMLTSGTLAAGDTATWSQTFNSPTAGSGKTLTPTGIVVHGVADVTPSYDITFVPVTNGVITPANQPQTISFDLSAVVATYGDDPVSISATATSGLTVGFASLTPAVCTVSGTDVTIVKAGTCTIRASQAGNPSWAPAPNVDESFTVAQRAITVTAVTDTKAFNGSTASAGVPTITSGSLATGDTATWTQTFDTAAVGTGKTLTATGTVAHGVTNVTASYDITFVPDTTGEITEGIQSITFDLSAVTATYGNAPVSISATATSGLTVGFASLTSPVCTVAGTNVTIVTAGTCTIRASQPGNGSWFAAPDADESFTVARRAITVTAVTDTKTFDGTTTSDGVPTITAGTLATGDTATWTQTFNTAAAGTAKTLTPAGTVAKGVTDVTAQYLITITTNITGVIGPGPADVTKSTVKATPPNVKNDGVDTTTITVQLRTAANALLIASGGTVTIFANHGSVSVVTDHNTGSYTAIYTSDTFVGNVTVTAQLNGTPITATDTINQH